MAEFETKDSGERVAFESGMVRDTQTGKPRYGLIPLGPLKRVAELYGRGADKYDARNWEKANSVDELERFRESAFRHLMQLCAGETDEDHGAAVVFNVFAIMWLEERLAARRGVVVVPADLSVADVEAVRAAFLARHVCTCGEGNRHLPECALSPNVMRARDVPDVAGRDVT